MTHHYHYGGSDIWSLFYMLFWLLLIFIGAFITVYYLRRDYGGKSTGNEAIAVLKKRYAQGEIDKKEFEEKKKDLKK